MCNSTTKVISLSKLKYSYPPLAGNIPFHNILKQLCLLYSASFEFSCFCYICLSLLFIGIVTYLVTYLLMYLLTHSLTPWLCSPVRALACLFTDSHSSVLTAFCFHLITFISHRSFCTSSSHLTLDLPLLLFSGYSQIFS